MLKEVTVKVSELLEALEENRQNHVKEYEESIAGYKDSAKEKLKQARITALDNLKTNFTKIEQEINDFDPENAKDYFELLQQEMVHLPVPRNHSQEYDQAIAMVGWEQNEEIILTNKQFRTLILDEWDWQEQFKTVSAFYNGK